MISILSGQKRALRAAAKRYKIKLIIAFGSQVSGITHDLSDVDISALPHGNRFSFGLYSNLLQRFEKIFPGKKIDLSFINRADPLLLSRICNKPQLLYGSKRDLNKLKMYSFKRYADHQPYFDIESNFVNKFIRRLSRAH